jgi:hypothetical protein
MGPESVLKDFEQLLAVTTPSPANRRAMFRLALAEHLRQAAGKSAPVKPYFVALDPRQYQTLETTDLKATLTVDEHGEVTDATFEPKQPAVIDYQLVNDAGNWRFLPAIKEGKPVTTTVVLPIRMTR